jgi:hypothetical protein
MCQECYGIYSRDCPFCGTINEDPTLELCKCCLNYAEPEEFGEFKGVRMCLSCVEQEQEEAQNDKQRQQKAEEMFRFNSSELVSCLIPNNKQL